MGGGRWRSHGEVTDSASTHYPYKVQNDLQEWCFWTVKYSFHAILVHEKQNGHYLLAELLSAIAELPQELRLFTTFYTKQV
jgi:hypothetical protein